MSVAPEEQYSTACEEHQPLDTPGNNPHQHYGAAYPAASPALPHIQPTTTLDAAIASYTEPNSFCDWRAEEDSSFYSSNSSSCSSSGTEDYFFFGQNVSPSAPSVPATPHFSHVASGTSSTPYYQPVSHSGVPMYSAPVGSVASPDSAASLPANLYSPGNVYVRPQLWHRHAYQGPLGASLAAAAQDGLEAGGAVDPQNIAPEVYNSMTQQGLVQPDEIDPFDTIRDSSNRSSTYSSVFDSPFFGDPFQQQHIDSSPESAPASVPLTVQRSFSQLPLDKDDTIGRSASRSAKKPSPARSSRRMQPEATTIQALDLEGLQLTSQGTIKGHRMPVRGVNPSTTGCFMDLNDDTPYHAMGTKRSRGRSPHTKAYLSMLLESPSRIGELVQIVGATKGGKPKRFFPCPVEDCQAWFRRSEHSKRHIRSLHTDERPFLCPESTCGRLFTRVDNLNQHVRLKHPDSDCVRKGAKPDKVRARPMSTASRAALRCGSPTTSISSKSSCGSSKRRSAGAAAHDSHSDSEDEADDEDYIP